MADDEWVIRDLISLRLRILAAKRGALWMQSDRTEKSFVVFDSLQNRFVSSSKVRKTVQLKHDVVIVSLCRVDGYLYGVEGRLFCGGQ